MRHQARRGIRLIALGGAMTLTLAGCVEIESTMYLDADGGVTWVILEKDVRYADPGVFADFITEAKAGRHRAVTALQKLGADETRTHVLRGRPPAMVFGEGRFHDFDLLWDRICQQVGGWPMSEIRLQRSLVTWSLHCAPDLASLERLEENDVAHVYELFEDFEIVLEQGRFVSASGFKICDGGQKAVMEFEDRDEAPWGAVDDEPREFTLSLTWDVNAGQ